MREYFPTARTSNRSAVQVYRLWQNDISDLQTVRPARAECGGCAAGRQVLQAGPLALSTMGGRQAPAQPLMDLFRGALVASGSLGGAGGEEGAAAAGMHAGVC